MTERTAVSSGVRDWCIVIAVFSSGAGDSGSARGGEEKEEIDGDAISGQFVYRCSKRYCGRGYSREKELRRNDNEKQHKKNENT